MSKIFGYYDSPEQIKPAFDPGLVVSCPFCLAKLELPVKTISLMAENDDRSYFYRAHKNCYEAASEISIQEIEGSLIDSIPRPTTHKPGSATGRE